MSGHDLWKEGGEMGIMYVGGERGSGGGFGPERGRINEQLKYRPLCHGPGCVKRLEAGA